MRINQRGVIILPILIIVLLLGVISYLIFQNTQLKKEQPNLNQPTATPISTLPPPTSSPTDNWKTYTNTAYGYSVQFPSSWRTQLIAAGAGDQEALPNSRHVDFFDPNIKTNDPSTGASKGVITIQYFDLLPEQFSDTPYDYQIGNAKAIKKENVYYVKANRGILEILVLLPENKQEEPTFNQILSTLNFIQ